MKKAKEVIKHSASTQISNNVTLLQRKAWNLLLANAFDDLSKQDQFKISLKELCTSLNYESHNEEYLKQILIDLMHITVEWNILKKDKKEWGVAVLLAQAIIENGIVRYGYAPIIRERLQNPSMYAKISLSLQNKFDSKHTLALYELCVDHFIAKRGYGQTEWISIEDFRKLCGLAENEYSDFKELNKFVIKKSLDEINLKTDLLVNVEFQRKTRKIVALKFYIKKNPNSVIDVEPVLNKALTSSPPSETEIKESEVNNQALLKSLTEFGINRNKAVEIIKGHDEFYITEILNYVDKQVKAGRVKDVAGFTIKALEKDYRPQKTKFDIEKEDVERKRMAILMAEQEKQERENEFKRLQMEEEQRIEDIIKALPAKERQKLEQEAERIVINKLGELPAGANKFLWLNRQVCIEIEMQRIVRDRGL